MYLAKGSKPFLVLISYGNAELYLDLYCRFLYKGIITIPSYDEWKGKRRRFDASFTRRFYLFAHNYIHGWLSMVNNVHRNQGQLKLTWLVIILGESLIFMIYIINITCLLMEQGFRLKHLAVELSLQHLSTVPQVSDCVLNLANLAMNGIL